MEVWQKRISFFNSILIFLGIVIYFSTFGYYNLKDYYYNYLRFSQPRNHGPMVNPIFVDSSKTIQDSLVKQDVYFDDMLLLNNEGQYIVPIKTKDFNIFQPMKNYLGNESASIAGSASDLLLIPESANSTDLEFYAFSEYNSNMNNVINILFIDKIKGNYILVFDKTVLIRSIDFRKGGRINDRNVSNQDYILYSVSTEDNDGDGRITHNDINRLYISDLFGGNLKKVLPDSLIANHVIKKYKFNELLIYTTTIPTDKSLPKDDWKKDAFTYSIKSGEITQFIPPNVLLKARKILWRN